MEESSTIARSKSADNELLPKAGSDDVGRRVFRMLEEVIRFKNDQGLPAKWHRCYELTRNKHWRNPGKKGVSLVTANMLFTHRERTVAQLTDNSPTFNISQAGEMDAEKEELVNVLLHTAEHWWKDTEQQSVLEESVTQGETYGITIEKVRFNPDEEYGLGEVECDVVDPFYFGWYPVKARPEKAQAVLHFWPMSIREARRRWPDMADKIVSDKEWVNQVGDGRLDVKSPLGEKRQGYFASIMGTIKHMIDNSADGKNQDEDILIVECWVKDFSRTVEDGQEVDLYPGNVRCVWTCSGGEVVLEDRKNPSINWEVLDLEQAAQTYLFSRFPFIVTHSINDTTNQWGMTDLEQLESLNIEINKTLSQITLFKDKTSRIKIINPEGSGVSNKDFTNAPGIINPNITTAGLIRYMDPPPIPGDLPAILQVYKDLFFLVSGAFDLEQGKTVGDGVIAYRAIAALLERVATMLRRKLRNYHKLIRSRGRMYISCAMNWYVEDRWISYEQDGGPVTRAIKGPDLIIPAKLNVVSGSTMPVSKVQQREDALELFKLGAIDIEELLKRMEWPAWKDVSARMKLGPIGTMTSRLTELGLPEQAAQYFQEVGTMDEKEFDRMLESGELMPVDQVLQPQAVGETGPNPVETADIQVKQAQVQKVMADIEYVKEQIRALQTEQQVKAAGVQFDKEKLAIERARTVTDIKRTQTEMERGAQQDVREDVRTAHEIESEKKREKREDKKLSVETKTREAEQNAQGPYREKGLSSNNKE